MIRRRIYIVIGCLCVALGAIGVVVPGLPTTPFLLAASWLFYRSSPRLQEWLLESPLGLYVRSYQSRGGMRPSTKLFVIALMVSMVTCSVVLVIDSRVVDWIVATFGVIGCLVVIFAVPTAKQP